MLRSTLLLVAAVLSGGIGHAVAATSSAGCSAQSSWHAAFRIESIANGPRLGVWYPTNDVETPREYSSGVNGNVALNGSAACGTFPLVVFSHGYGGCSIQTVFFTEELARHGYVVAAPDHQDAGCSVDGTGSDNYVPPEQSFFSPQDWTDATYANRRDDMAHTIDWMTHGSAVSAHVDSTRIGGAGHSLGGYTILGVTGAWTSWKDPRIRAALVFSPYANPFLYQSRLHGVNVPVMYQGATGDFFITPFLKGSGGALALSNSPKFFAELQGGSHFSWTNMTCGSQPASACAQTQPSAMLIDTYAFAFLDAYVKGDKSALGALNGAGLAEWDHMSALLNVPSAYATEDSAVAPGSIMSSYGVGLATGTGEGDAPTLPTSIAGTNVIVTDSGGTNFTAPLYYVSPTQVNFVVPAQATAGAGVVTIYSQGNIVASGPLQIDLVAPAIFTAGAGNVAAAQYLRVSADGAQAAGITFDPATSAAAPIDLGQPGDSTFIILYGTGMRGAASVTATIGTTTVPTVGPFVQSVYPGMDQVNVGPIPHSLAGSGSVNLVLTLAGKSTAAVNIAIL